MSEIQRAEFDRLYDVMQAGFSGVHSRLDRLNGKVGEHGEEIARLQERTHPAAAGGIVAGVLVGAAEALKWVFGK